MAKEFRDIFELCFGQGLCELQPKIGWNGAIRLCGGLRGEAHHPQRLLIQVQVFEPLRHGLAIGGDAVVIDPQFVAAFLRPPCSHHTQVCPSDHDWIALQGKENAAFVVVVAQITLIHLSGAKPSDQEGFEVLLTHHGSHASPSAIAFSQTEFWRVDLTHGIAFD